MKLANYSQLKPHYKSIIKLGIPIVVGQIGIVLVGLLDNIMVGRYATEDLAVASFVNNVFNLPIFIGLGFSYGLTTLVGIAFGQNDNQKSASLLRNSLLLNILVGFALSIAMFVLWLNVDRLGQPEELIELIRKYFVLHMVSLPFVMGFNGFKQFSDGINDTKTPMYIMLSANIINVVGNFILIYGLFGIPALGVVGAGISTLVSRIFMLAAFVYIFFKSDKYSKYNTSFITSKLDRLSLKKLSGMGSMVAMQMGMETALFSVTAVMVGWLGKIELASHQILTSLSTVGFMIYYGVGAAICVKVSNYKGVKDSRNISLCASAGRNIILLMAITTSLLLLILRKDIGYLFTTETEIVDIVSILIYTLIAYQFGDAIQITYANALRGVADVVTMAIISIIGYFVIAIPVSYICSFVLNMGLQGIWLGYPVGLTLAGIAMWIRFKSITKS